MSSSVATVVAAQTGDAEAFTQLVRAWATTVCAIGTAITTMVGRLVLPREGPERSEGTGFCCRRAGRAAVRPRRRLEWARRRDRCAEPSPHPPDAGNPPPEASVRPSPMRTRTA